MTTLADMALTVRRSLGDHPKTVVDVIPSYDGSSNPMPTGKDLPIETGSETIMVNGVTQTRGVHYTIDYDARQTTWLSLPAAGTALRLQYKESRYKTEQVYEAINQGRRILFPTLYKKDIATVTIRNQVRDYTLSGSDCNEAAMRVVFTDGHTNYKILKASYMVLGTSDQRYTPFRNFYQEGESGIHIWESLPAGYSLRLEVAYAFKPLVNASDVTDIPDAAQSLVTEWAISALALKQTPERGRIDTYNVQQGNFGNPPQTMAQTSDDFVRRVREIRGLLNTEPMVIEPRNMPHRFEAGISR